MEIYVPVTIGFDAVTQAVIEGRLKLLPAPDRLYNEFDDEEDYDPRCDDLVRTANGWEVI